MQFNRHGERVWRQTQELLDSEHARRRVGEVVVPFGVCAEPSNVQAGGNACPYRFRCVGCDHFRTDISYLPDLHAHLDDLLRNRERVLATQDLEDWARTEALPSEAEITRMRRLIGKVEAGLDQLGAAEREQIEQAVTLVRRHPHRRTGHAPHPSATARHPPAALMTQQPASTRTAAATAGRRADTARRRERLLTALSKAITSGQETSVGAIAQAAAVDRTFLYRHRGPAGEPSGV
jgi:hypothetical protein